MSPTFGQGGGGVSSNFPSILETSDSVQKQRKIAFNPQLFCTCVVLNKHSAKSNFEKIDEKLKINWINMHGL